MGKLIAILNQKGGVGKTTTTINLASALSKTGKTILIVDFDPQGNATSGLGIDKNNLSSTVYDVITGQAGLADSILDTEIEGVSLLPANANLAASEIEISELDSRETRLRDVLSGVDHDFILIDCPPALGLLTVNALTVADLLLVPVQAEYYALEGLSQLLSVMQRVKHSLNPELELLGVVLTMYDSRNSLASQVKEELDKYFGDKVFKTVIPRNVRLAEAPSYGKSIFEHDKWSKGARAYKQFAKEVEKRVE